MALTHTQAQFSEVLTKRAIALLEDKEDFAVLNQGAIPLVPTTVFNGTFKKYKASDFRRRSIVNRASGSEYQRFNMDLEDVSFRCQEKGSEFALDDRDAAQIEGSLESISEKLVEDAYNRYDTDLLAEMNTTNFTAYKTGVASDSPSTNQFAQWSRAASTPIDDVIAWKLEIKKKLGVDPDSLLITQDVFNALQSNAQILARMATVVDKHITVAKLKEFFGLKNIYILASTYTSTADGQATQTIDLNATKKALLYYRGVGGAFTPSTIQCFYNTATYGKGTNGIFVLTYREDKIQSDVTRVRLDYDIVVSMPEGGILLEAVIA